MATVLLAATLALAADKPSVVEEVVKSLIVLTDGKVYAVNDKTKFVKKVGKKEVAAKLDDVIAGADIQLEFSDVNAVIKVIIIKLPK